MVVFLLLGVVWAAVLVPPWLQSRREARSVASISSFRSQLWSLQRATPHYDADTYTTYTGEDEGVDLLGDAEVDDLAAGAPYVPRCRRCAPPAAYRRRRRVWARCPATPACRARRAAGWPDRRRRRPARCSSPCLRLARRESSGPRIRYLTQSGRPAVVVVTPTAAQ